jgi:hypothetical protein
MLLRIFWKAEKSGLAHANNLFVLCHATDVHKVAEVAAMANRRHRLRALFIQQDIDTMFLLPMLDRAHLRMLRNVASDSRARTARGAARELLKLRGQLRWEGDLDALRGRDRRRGSDVMDLKEPLRTRTSRRVALKAMNASVSRQGRPVDRVFGVIKPVEPVDSLELLDRMRGPRPGGRRARRR